MMMKEVERDQLATEEELTTLSVSKVEELVYIALQ